MADTRAFFDVLLALYLTQGPIPQSYLRRDPDDSTCVDTVVRNLLDLGLAKIDRVQEVDCVCITAAGDHFMAGQTSGSRWASN